MSLTGFVGGLDAQFLETQMGSVSIDEFSNGMTHLFDVAEHPPVDRLLLEGSIEALGNTVGLWLGDEREAGRDAPELHLVQEVVRHVLRAWSMCNVSPRPVWACTPPKWRTSPWLSGSTAANRSPTLARCQPTHSA